MIRQHGYTSLVSLYTTGLSGWQQNGRAYCRALQNAEGAKNYISSKELNY